VTTEEQYAAIGKAHADLRANKEKIRALMAKAQEMGSAFEELGHALCAQPDHVGINGESPMPVNLVPPGQGQLFDRKLFDADQIKKLTDDIRNTTLEIIRLENLLK
jgi:hypothetical protein